MDECVRLGLVRVSWVSRRLVRGKPSDLVNKIGSIVRSIYGSAGHGLWPVPRLQVGPRSAPSGSGM